MRKILCIFTKIRASFFTFSKLTFSCSWQIIRAHSAMSVLAHLVYQNRHFQPKARFGRFSRSYRFWVAQAVYVYRANSFVVFCCYSSERRWWYGSFICDSLVSGCERLKVWESVSLADPFRTDRGPWLAAVYGRQRMFPAGDGFLYRTDCGDMRSFLWPVFVPGDGRRRY